MQHLNYLAILVSALCVFLLGAPWYSKVLFGPAWGRANGLDPKAGRHGHPAKVFGLSFAFALIAAFAFAWWLGPEPEIHYAFHRGLIAGVLVATSFGINYLFADKPLVLLAIDGGYHIVQFLAYAVVLGLWH